MKKRAYEIVDEKGKSTIITGVFKNICKRTYGSKVTITRLTRKRERELLEDSAA